MVFGDLDEELYCFLFYFYFHEFAFILNHQPFRNNSTIKATVSCSGEEYKHKLVTDSKSITHFVCYRNEQLQTI